VEAIGVRELRQNASRYVMAARDGKAFVVTSRGVPVARLVPLNQAGDRHADLVARGEIVPAARHRRPVDVSTLLDGDLTTHLDEMRDDR
jgi:prevent-host-death family protein